MTILEYLQSTSNVRLFTEDRWMYWDTGAKEWVVLQRGYNKKKNRCLYRGASEEEAVSQLQEGIEIWAERKIILR